MAQKLGSSVALAGKSRAGKSPQVVRTYEEALATKIAGVKLILAILNISVVVIDPSVPAAGMAFGLTITGIFLAYMGVSYVALSRNWVSIKAYRVTGPFVDVIFCALLIIGTDGYLSPFNLWLAMSLVAASFSSDQRIVLWATGLAVVVGVIIAVIPQQRSALNLPVFVVRTGFLLAFGLVIASIGNHLARVSSFLSAIDAYATGAALCDTVPEAAETLLDNIDACLRPASLLLELDDGSRFTRGNVDKFPASMELTVASGTAQYGRLWMAPATAVTNDDVQIVHTMLDRFCLSLRRLFAVDELRRSATQEARLRLADELHDTHVQTLTAIDFQIESLLNKSGKNDAVRGDLRKMRDLARQSIVDLRDFISHGPIESTDNLDEIIARATKNWKGRFESKAEPDLYLTRACWLAIEVLLREGLANARQHAQADWALFTLERRGDFCVAMLQTNGRSPDLPLRRQGYGLTRVSAAVTAAGGELLLTERVGGGASLSATFTEMSS
jgi:signal transduction histidine kinase